jgi:N-acetylmuramoyl-L-alanine amidase
MIRQVKTLEVKTMPGHLVVRRQTVAWQARGIPSLLPPTWVLLFLLLLWGAVHVPLLILGQGYSFRTILAWGLPDNPKGNEEGRLSLNMAITGLTGVDPGYLPGVLRSVLADAELMPLSGNGTIAAVAPATGVEHPSNEPGSSSVNTPPLPQQPVAKPNSRGTRGVLAGKLVVLDPGHGGNDTGAIGPDGIEEKWVTLPIATKAAQLLRQEGAEVIMTRTGDTNPDLYARTDIANLAEADVFVSIHGNSYPSDPSIGGTGTYIYAPSPVIAPGQQLNVRLRLANCLQNTLVAALRLHNSRGIFDDNLEVLRNAQMPAALVEVAFLSNRREERLFNDTNFQQKAGTAIAIGIVKFLTGQ